MKQRILVVAAAAAAVVLGLTSCSGAGSDAASGDVTITFAHWGNNQEAATLKSMIASFEQSHPDITVQENWIQSDYEQKLQTTIAGGKQATVSQISNTSLASFAAAYQPVDVDPSVYYSTNIASSMQVDGKYYAVPFVVKTKVMAVNGKVFDAAGIPVPSTDTPMTTAEFAETAQKLTSGEAPNKVYGSARLWYGGWLNVEGGSIYDSAGKKCTLDTDVAIKAAEDVIAAQAPDGFAPTNLEAEGQDMFDWLSIGRVAMQPDFGPWDIAKVVDLKDPSIKLVPVPGKGEPMEINGLGIAKSATPEETKAAKTFAAYLSTDKQAQDQLTTAKSSLGVPVIEQSLDAFRSAAPDLNLDAFITAVDQSTIVPSVKKDAQIQTDFNNEVNSRTALGAGKEAPSKVFPEANKACQAVIDGE